MRPSSPPSRRQLLEIALVAGAAASFAEVPSRAAPGGAKAREPLPLEALLPKIHDLRDQFLARAAAWVDDGRLVRPDGFVYAVDVAQLMACFAAAADEMRYEALRAYAVRHLLVDDPSDPFTRGFVFWRHKPADPAGADASGTTEALRLAEALWLGAETFDRSADRELVLTVLRGYARHETVDQGVWMIRNYFGFGTRSFASNSFLVDYDPDFVMRVADETGDAALALLAQRSCDVVRRAQTPAGLLYDLIQPELKTMYPLLAESVVVFSPNDVVQLSNACTVALTVTAAASQVARRVLDFALARLSDPTRHGPLRTYHYGRTGEPVNETEPGINEWGALLRLAAGLNDRDAAALLADRALPHWDYYLTRTGPEAADAFVASEALAATTAAIGLENGEDRR